MNDPGVGRHHPEALERLLGPAQQGVTLTVALELLLRVHLEGGHRAELVHDHRVVDHQLGREQRVHRLGVPTHPGHRVAHRRQVHDRGHPGEVLHQHAGRHERDLLVGHLLGVPASELLDVLVAHGPAIFEAQQVLEQDLQRVREARDWKARSLQGVKPVDLVGATARLECGAAAEAVHSTVFTSDTKYSVSPKQLEGMPLCWR